MKKPSENPTNPQFLREKIIGLGETSIRKNYYPQLQQRLEEVEQARHTIEESEARYRYLVENIRDVIFSLDPEGRITYISPTVANLGGWIAEQLIGYPLIEFIHPRNQKALAKNIETGKCENCPLEMQFLGADGVYRHTLLSCQFADKNNPGGGTTGLLSDITPLKKAEHEKEKLQQQLNQAQKLDSIGQLAGGIAHDFNNLLSIIMGNAELALNAAPEDSVLHQNLQEIFTTSQRASKLTRQLLTFARKQKSNPQIIDLNKSVEDILKMMRRLLGENIDLCWDPCQDDTTVKMDPSQLDQILANLCVNARDAIQDTGMITIDTKRVIIDAEYCKTHPGEGLEEEFVVLSFSDNGCGMSQKELEHIFEPFYSTKSPDKGTGLGLATVYGIIKQNQGFITVYSEQGTGTTFNVHLPLVSDKKPPEKSFHDGSKLKTGTETILLVEDDLTLLHITRRLLEKLQYTVIAESHPLNAIETARNFAGEIDLLLSDIVMPQMNGVVLAEKIAEIRPQAMRLFMSGYADHAAVRHGIVNSTANFIQKPFTSQALSEKLREILDKD